MRLLYCLCTFSNMALEGRALHPFTQKPTASIRHRKIHQWNVWSSFHLRLYVKTLFTAHTRLCAMCIWLCSSCFTLHARHVFQIAYRVKFLCATFLLLHRNGGIYRAINNRNNNIQCFLFDIELNCMVCVCVAQWAMLMPHAHYILLYITWVHHALVTDAPCGLG